MQIENRKRRNALLLSSSIIVRHGWLCSLLLLAFAFGLPAVASFAGLVGTSSSFPRPPAMSRRASGSEAFKKASADNDCKDNAADSGARSGRTTRSSARIAKRGAESDSKDSLGTEVRKSAQEKDRKRQKTTAAQPETAAVRKAKPNAAVRKAKPKADSENKKGIKTKQPQKK
eukprot:3357669-Rhodomonas_salina.1